MAPLRVLQVSDLHAGTREQPEVEDDLRARGVLTGDRGSDVISLAAYIFRCRQIEAARTLAATFGLEVR